MGRFMTPDWAARATSVPYAVFGDPRTLNLYTNVENSPLNRVDADGHGPTGPQGTQDANCAQSDGPCATNPGTLTTGAQNSNQAQAADNNNKPETNSEHTWLYKLFHPFGEDHIPTLVDLLQGSMCKIACAMGSGRGESQKASESADQMAEASAGKGRAIAGADTNKTLRDAGRLASEYGGDPADWRKMATSNAVNKGMENFEIHYYQNVKTGQVSR